MKNILLSIFLLFSTAAFAQTWIPVGSPEFSDTTANYISLAIDGSGTPYIAYMSSNGYGNVSVKKYNGSSWVNVGGSTISAGSANSTDLAIDNSGTPYVAYEDMSSGYKATVMKYNGSSWVTVGVAGFSADVAENLSIAIDTGGTPYVAYRDFGDSEKATVMKYNGSSWVPVGSAGFSAYSVFYTSIAIDGSGTPYIAYQGDTDNDTPAFYGPATVMKFDGTDWVTVGNPGFTSGSAQYTSLAIGNDGTPYVVYQDDADSEKASVMKYNGSSWVNVGSPGFSEGGIYSTSIVIDNSGTPYVSYIDDTMSILGPVAVKKFDGSNWVSLGGDYCSDSLAVFTSIALDGSGTPYVAFGEFGGYEGGSGKATVMKLDTSTESIKNISNPANSLSIFPNPTTDELNITGVADLTNYRLLSVTGSCIRQGVLQQGSNTVSLNDIVPGIYVLELTGTAGERNIVKVVKE